MLVCVCGSVRVCAVRSGVGGWIVLAAGGSTEQWQVPEGWGQRVKASATGQTRQQLIHHLVCL